MVGHRLTFAIIVLAAAITSVGAPQASAGMAECEDDDYEPTHITSATHDSRVCMNLEYCPVAGANIDQCTVSICATNEAWMALPSEFQPNGDHVGDMQCRSPAMPPIAKAVAALVQEAGPPSCTPPNGGTWYPVDESTGNGDGNLASLWHDYYGHFAITYQSSQETSANQADKFFMAAGLRDESGTSFSFNEAGVTSTCKLMGYTNSGNIKWTTMGVLWADFSSATESCTWENWSEYSVTNSRSGEVKAKFSLKDPFGVETVYTQSKSETTRDGQSSACGSSGTSTSDFGITAAMPEQDSWIGVPRCSDEAIVFTIEISDGIAASGGDIPPPRWFLVSYKDPECPSLGAVELWWDCNGSGEWDPEFDCLWVSTSEGTI